MHGSQLVFSGRSGWSRRVFIEGDSPVRNPFIVGVAAMAAGVGLSVAPAAAQVDINVFNQSARTITGLNAYPIAGDGSIIDDNIGGYYEPIGPRGMGTITVGDPVCGTVLILINIDGSIGDEARATLDTCESQALILSD